MPRTATRSTSRTATPTLKFDQRLVLFDWMLSLLEVKDFNELAEQLKAPDFEGFDEDNTTRFYNALSLRLIGRTELNNDILRAYDENIVRHWRAITESRNSAGNVLLPKYFQYLSLLFTEIYLDRYFRDTETLRHELNEHVEKFNADKNSADQVMPYEAEDLNKIAFWEATGSGKTLLMHINILQYRHYLELHGNERELNRIIVLTPNEGLSNQHLHELQLSRMDAEKFVKDGRSLFAGRSVEIIDIHKLADQSGEKTVSVEAFEGNNLVLVDEGHRGAGGDDWMKKRDQLCEGGFSFEYSATFGQAMQASKNKSLTQKYAKCILFDYSYKYFYGDGYGKDYRILNLADDSNEEVRELYLTACLLSFYQQQKLFKDRHATFANFLLERPLWVFVGGSVNAVRSQGGRQVSDVVDILLFLSDFVRQKTQSAERLQRLIDGKAELLDSGRRNLFLNCFTYLNKQNFTGQTLFDDILRVLFNAPAAAALHVENLKGKEGEIALRLGENEPFGVINVGDTSSLCKLCESFDALVVTDKEFSGSLFQEINKKDSPINILIGSKKFSEGWSSWRVSTMGLMNIGRTEGSEIIQLFGRGVRLKGFNFCLKRSRHVLGITAPNYIEILETLNIFGVRADYMKQFKEYLEDEGLPTDEEQVEFVLPVIPNLGSLQLKTLKVKDGIDFKKDGPKPTLALPDSGLLKSPIALDWYPKIQAEASRGLRNNTDVATRHEGKLTARHLAFMDFDELYFALQGFKNEKSWHNLNLSKENIYALLEKPDWYTLYIPEAELEFGSFRRVRVWQEIALALLKKYCDKFYKQRKDEFELPHLEYRALTLDDSNFISEYRFLIEKSQDLILQKLTELKAQMANGQTKDFEFGNMSRAISFNRHLYQPLIYLAGERVKVSPVSLNEGERDFVLDLRKFHDGNPDFFADKELYLLRNQSKGKGIGFFEAGNFYPDFILWLLVGSKQYVTFVDPKGIRNLQGPHDPKIAFHQRIKELEQRLADPAVILNSFIVANTSHREVGWWSEGMSKADFEAHHVLFQKEDKATYVSNLLAKLLV